MIEDIKSICREAGQEILKYYGRAGRVEAKADDSPLTQADRAAHTLICRRLQSLDPAIPVLSEESDESEIRERRAWKRFWLVDPLDGTKEFIKQTGEFTVNIALIRDGQPVLGVIHVPARDRTYFAESGRGAWKEIENREAQAIRVRSAPAEKGPEAALTIVASRDHAGPQVQELLARYPDATATSMGSSLKFCLVAEGAADLYLRDVPTMEWDVAAAQCVVESAGGRVLTLNGTSLHYNKESLRNPPLLTAGDPALADDVLANLQPK